MRSLLTCHGDYLWADADDFCLTECTQVEECKRFSELLHVPNIVFCNVEKRARAQQRCEAWLKRTEIYVKSYVVGFSPSMRCKREIQFGQLRRGLVLRKRMEEKRR